jgi:hypothetical protein
MYPCDMLSKTDLSIHRKSCSTKPQGDILVWRAADQSTSMTSVRIFSLKHNSCAYHRYRIRVVGARACILAAREWEDRGLSFQVSMLP